MNHRYNDKRESISEELNSEPRENTCESFWRKVKKKKIFPDRPTFSTFSSLVIGKRGKNKEEERLEAFYWRLASLQIVRLIMRISESNDWIINGVLCSLVYLELLVSSGNFGRKDFPRHFPRGKQTYLFETIFILYR